MDKGLSRWRRARHVLGFLSLLLPAAGAYAIFLEISSAIRAGDGGKLYRTGWGYKASAYGVLAVFVALVLGVTIAAVIWWLSRREERDFVRKYGPRE